MRSAEQEATIMVRQKCLQLQLCEISCIASFQFAESGLNGPGPGPGTGARVGWTWSSRPPARTVFGRWWQNWRITGLQAFTFTRVNCFDFWNGVVWRFLEHCRWHYDSAATSPLAEQHCQYDGGQQGETGSGGFGSIAELKRRRNFLFEVKQCFWTNLAILAI